MKYNYSDYNDYELIDLIREGNDDALEIMFKKYEPLIRSRIQNFNIKPMMVDDFYQEGRMALDKAINTYDMSSPKTFNKFFDMVLQRRFISLLRKNKKYFENTVYIDDINPNLLQEEKKLDYDSIEVDDYDFTELEKKVYYLKHEKGCKPRTIAQILGINVKKVYNATDRIKAKIKRD